MCYYSRRILYKLSLLLLLGEAIAFAAWAGGAGVGASGPLFVSPAGNDTNSCQTFAMACRTLGAAVTKAASGDTIIIGAGVYTESVTLDRNLTLIGFGSDATFISVGDINRVLENSAGISSNVYDVSIVGGSGGIFNYGALTLTNSAVSNNRRGGIYNAGVLTVNHSSIHDNQGYYGGGLYNANGTATLNSSSIVSNSVHVFGGGSTTIRATLS